MIFLAFFYLNYFLQLVTHIFVRENAKDTNSFAKLLQTDDVVNDYK